MTELRFRNGVVLSDPLALALLLLEHDYSYRTYDSQPTRADAEWRREDAQIANRAGARMSSREIDALMGRSDAIEDALRRIPGDQSLADPSEQIPWEALGDLYAAFGGIPGIGLAKATKALHKKRPHLVPMLDSVVAGYLRSVDGIPVGDFAAEALGLTKSYKVDLDANADTLVSVQHGLNEQGYTLGLCRILDLYTWTYAGEKPPTWASGAAHLISRTAADAPPDPTPVDESIDEGAELAADLGIELDEGGMTLRILRAVVREVGYVQACHELKALVRQSRQDLRGPQMSVFNVYNDALGDSGYPEGWCSTAAAVGEQIGGELIGAGLYELEPGTKLGPYHTHHANEEWLLVLQGQPTLRTPEGERQLDEGDIVCFPRGKAGAHQVRNGTDSPLRVLMLSTKIAPEIVEYLDTGKVGARSVAGERIMFGRPGPTLDYWEGEE